MLVNLSEASRILGISTQSIRRRIKNGEWPSYRLGPKSLRLDLSEIKSLGRLISEVAQEQKKERVS